MFDTLEALQERVPALELPLGRVQAILTPLLVLGVALALLLWVGSVSALGGLVVAVVVMAGCSLLAREALATAETRPYEGVFFYQILPLAGLHAALLVAFALTGGDSILPGWVAWPVFGYLLLTGLALLGRALGEAGLGRWILLSPSAPQGALHQTLVHPALGGLARVALALAAAAGSPLALLLAVIYAWILLPGWARALVILRPAGAQPRIWPPGLLGEARLLASLIDPLSPPPTAEAPAPVHADEEPIEDEDSIEFTDENSGFSDENSEAEVIEHIERPAQLPVEE